MLQIKHKFSMITFLSQLSRYKYHHCLMLILLETYTNNMCGGRLELFSICLWVSPYLYKILPHIEKLHYLFSMDPIDEF